MKKQMGFTLIELLVVVAIISILAAILFPVFARARENARRASCASNMKQIGLAMMQYSQDYDEKVLASALSYYHVRPDGTASTTALWPDLVQPYIKSIQVFNCPSSDKAYTGGGAGGLPFGYNYRKPSTCSSNCGVDMGGNTGVGGASLAAIDDPSGTIAIVDAVYYLVRLDHNNFTREQAVSASECQPSGGSDNFAGCVQARHLDTVNTLFVDGHVKSMQWSAILNGSNAVRYWTTSDD
jgi:prepilin-type N-terminal cleavage/methylation domain-containing protein/prepilin-type processing-associated H-X9-DG protein